RFVEQVDHEGLAAPDLAPVVQALHRPWRARQQARQQPAVGRRQQALVDAVQLAQCRMLGRIIAPAPGSGALGVDPGRGAYGTCGHACGSQPLTSCWIAPRRSISLRWKKWLVSGMRTSCGLRSSVSIQSYTA